MPSVAYGAKTIGYFGSVCLLYNNITGSGLVLFPSLYQLSGALPTTLTIVVLTALTLVCSVMLLECMSAIPCNDHFQLRIEYTTICRYYLTPQQYHLSQLVFQLSLLVINITTIIQSVQVTDYALVDLFGSTCAIQFYPTIDAYCSTGQSASKATSIDNYTIFPTDAIVLSAGIIVTAILCIPLSLFNLEDNVVIQKFSTLIVLAISIVWTTLFCMQGLDVDRLPLIGTTYNELIGISIFNFACISTLPSWVNEKRTNVSILHTVTVSLLLAALSYICIGVFGSLSFSHLYGSNSSILDRVHTIGGVVATTTYFLFPLFVNYTSIPVFSIMIRYNLIENQICSERIASLVSTVLPWFVAMMFYTGSGFESIVNLGGLVAHSICNFILPAILYAHLASNVAYGKDVDFTVDGLVPTAVKRYRHDDTLRGVVSDGKAESLLDHQQDIDTHGADSDADDNAAYNAPSYQSDGDGNELDRSMFYQPTGITATGSMLESPQNVIDDEETLTDDGTDPYTPSIAPWHIVPPSLHHHRLRAAQAVIVLTTTLCSLAIVANFIEL